MGGCDRAHQCYLALLSPRARVRFLSFLLSFVPPLGLPLVSAAETLFSKQVAKEMANAQSVAIATYLSRQIVFHDPAPEVRNRLVRAVFLRYSNQFAHAEIPSNMSSTTSRWREQFREGTISILRSRFQNYFPEPTELSGSEITRSDFFERQFYAAMESVSEVDIERSLQEAEGGQGIKLSHLQWMKGVLPTFEFSKNLNQLVSAWLRNVFAKSSEKALKVMGRYTSPKTGNKCYQIRTMSSQPRNFVKLQIVR